MEIKQKRTQHKRSLCIKNNKKVVHNKSYISVKCYMAHSVSFQYLYPQELMSIWFGSYSLQFNITESRYGIFLLYFGKYPFLLYVRSAHTMTRPNNRSNKDEGVRRYLWSECVFWVIYSVTSQFSKGAKSRSLVYMRIRNKSISLCFFDTYTVENMISIDRKNLV